ncbi:hypothetical protein ACMFMG_001739 [Clarireedia jacksonii]
MSSYHFDYQVTALPKEVKQYAPFAEPRPEELFLQFGIPVEFYADLGSHFGNAVKAALERQGAVWTNSPVATKKAAGMAERAVGIHHQCCTRRCDELPKIPPTINREAIRNLYGNGV